MIPNLRVVGTIFVGLCLFSTAHGATRRFTLFKRKTTAPHEVDFDSFEPVPDPFVRRTAEYLGMDESTVRASHPLDLALAAQEKVGSAGTWVLRGISGVKGSSFPTSEVLAAWKEYKEQTARTERDSKAATTGASTTTGVALSGDARESTSPSARDPKVLPITQAGQGMSGSTSAPGTSAGQEAVGTTGPEETPVEQQTPQSIPVPSVLVENEAVDPHAPADTLSENAEPAEPSAQFEQPASTGPWGNLGDIPQQAENKTSGILVDTVPEASGLASGVELAGQEKPLGKIRDQHRGIMDSSTNQGQEKPEQASLVSPTELLLLAKILNDVKKQGKVVNFDLKISIGEEGHLYRFNSLQNVLVGSMAAAMVIVAALIIMEKSNRNRKRRKQRFYKVWAQSDVQVPDESTETRVYSGPVLHVAETPYARPVGDSCQSRTMCSSESQVECQA